MTYGFESSSRFARVRVPVLVALVLAFAGCESAEPFNPDSSSGPEAVEQSLAAAPELASASFSGGIPFGVFAQPTTEYGPRFNGGHKNISPNRVIQELAAIKARGGKVALVLAGSPRHFLDDGRFSLSMWKSRVSRFKDVNFSSYIKDGTIIGHYMIDEPNDAANWRGQPVSPSTLEEMAKFSKQLWPDMATIVRVDPSYLAGNHRYLDAAWAQYLHRRGDVGNYIRAATSAAQQKGLALIVGLNVLHGGSPQGTTMTPSEVESWGSALLSSTYPCAFISWTYNSSYLNSTGVKGAMDALRRKAQSRGSKSCRGSGA